MHFHLAIVLPRDARSVGTNRRLVDEALRSLGVDAGCREDLQLIITEACTNVIDHARDGVDYEVRVDIDAETCTIEVADDGRDTAMPEMSASSADLMSESGRGLFIIGALADTLQFQPREPHGLLLRAVKTLTWQAPAPTRPAANA